MANWSIPMQQYRSKTAATRPPSLVDGQLFLNQADGVLCWPNASGVVQTTPLPASSSGSGAMVLGTSPTITTPAITGGTLNNAVIGGTTPAAITGTAIKGNTVVQSAGYFQATTPTTVTAATYTALGTDSFIVFNPTATVTLTLPSATAGRIIWVKCIAAFAVNSASSNVLPIGSATVGTAILAAAAGKFAMLVGNGTNWTTMMAN